MLALHAPNATAFRGPVALNPASLQARGLVAWWPTQAYSGRNGLRDCSGYGGDAVFGVNTPASGWVRDRQFGHVYSFAGASFDAVSTSPYVLTPASTFTVALWVRATVGAVGSRYPLFTTRAGAGGGWALEFGSGSGAGSGRVVLVTPGVFNAETADGVFALNEWQHVVYSRSGGSNQRIYVNGVSRALGTDNPQTILANTNTAYFGYEVSGIYLTGPIADVRFHNVALTPAEVWHQYDPQTRFDLYAPAARQWVRAGPVGAANAVKSGTFLHFW